MLNKKELDGIYVKASRVFDIINNTQALNTESRIDAIDRTLLKSDFMDFLENGEDDILIDITVLETTEEQEDCR